MIWRRYPLFRAFLALCAGIMLANFGTISLKVSVIAISLGSLFLLFAFWRRGHLWGKRYTRSMGWAWIFFFLSLGLVVNALYLEKWHPRHVLNQESIQGPWYLELSSEPLEKDRSYGMEVRVLGRWDNNDNRLQGLRGKAMLYLAKTADAAQLHYGDHIVADIPLREMKPPVNPREFDYRDFLSLKAIYFQSYADSSQWRRVNEVGGWRLKRKLLEWRHDLLKRIEHWPLDSAGQGVSKALLLGFREEIQGELMQAYASAGAMHVLAVSGLHVGIVFLIARYLLFFIRGFRHAKLTKTFILVLVLWAYALLTGLSASVVRAATMFSFVAIGTGFGRHTSIYNTILVSAFFLLIIRPTYLFEVGFQLSYAAVFGIVWIQPRLATLWQPPNRALKLFWSIATVSVAAQVATFPLSLYYFHQFPALFLVSNLMVIPLITLLMYSGVPSLMLDAWGLAPDFLLQVYGFLLQVLNGAVRAIETWDRFLIKEITIGRGELVLLYLLVLLFFSWLFSGRYWRICGALVTGVLLGAYQYWENWDIRDDRVITAYRADYYQSLGFYDGERGWVLAEETLLKNEEVLRFHLRHHWWARNMERPQLMAWDADYSEESFWKKGPWIQFADKTVYLFSGGDLPPPLEVDIWCIGKGGYPPSQSIRLPDIILLQNLGEHQRQSWKTFAKAQGIPIKGVGHRAAVFRWK